MIGKRRAALVRMERVIERAKAKQVVAAQAPVQQESARLDQARVAKWICDRLVADWRDSCWLCRKPIVIGQKFVDVRGDGVIVRFHAQCEVEWRRAHEAAARRALGLDRSGRL